LGRTTIPGSRHVPLLNRAQRGCGLLLVAIVLSMTASPSAGDTTAQGGRVSEYDLKATVLLNLFRFTEWPPASFPSADAPYVLCVVGADPFGGSLPMVFNRQELHHRRFQIERMSDGDATAGCHVAFISSSEESRLSAILAKTAGQPTLTVSDASAFANAGGMVMLFTEGTRVRFSINEPVVRASGLRMSSLLLNLSRTPPALVRDGR
jgi:hypothetical protein